MAQIVGDIRVIEIELAGAVEAVAFLGDGHGDE